MLPEEYRGEVDLGYLAVASPYACYVARAPEGGYHWDLRGLARHEHHEGLHSLGVRVLFRVNTAARRLEAARIDSELGTIAPGQPRWELAKKLALCAVTTDVSMVRHFNGVHLAAGGLLAIATRNCLPADSSAAPHAVAAHVRDPVQQRAGDQGPDVAGRRFRLDLQPHPPRDVRAFQET